MATQKQNEANRRNAQHSTGPRSDCGKARAAMNNFKNGIYAVSPIIPGEDPAQRQALEDAYMARFNPRAIEQLLMVTVLIQLHWEEIRLVKADAHLWTYAINDAYKPRPDTVVGKAFQNNKETFTLLGRRRDANHRKYIATLHELESLQSAPDDLDDAEQSQPPDAAMDPAPPPAEPVTQTEPAAPSPAPPEAPAPAPQPVETAPPAPEMGSNPQHPTLSPNRPLTWHPNPGHPSIDECPNCSVLGYPSPSCRYKKPVAS